MCVFINFNAAGNTATNKAIAIVMLSSRQSAVSSDIGVRKGHRLPKPRHMEWKLPLKSGPHKEYRWHGV
jgi:hypothetical protein